MSSTPDIVAQLRQLQEAYTQQLPAKLAQIEQSLQKCGEPGEMPTLRLLTHGLAGSGGTFGYQDVSDVAQALEALADAALGAKRGLSEQERTSAGELMAALYRAAGRKAAWKPPPPEPAVIAAGVARKLIYLVEDDDELVVDLTLQLGHFGYTVRAFETPEQFLKAVADPALAVILMDIIFPQGDLAGAEAIMELVAARRLKAPVVFFSVRGDLPARLAAARAGAAGYFMKPLDVGSLVSMLDDLTSSAPPVPYRVLIVEDDMPLAEHYAYTLQAAGMHTDVVIDPSGILTHLLDFKPDLILMDMYMPGCSGAELTAVIRQLENHVLVPIVYLSAESDAHKQLMALKLGGDDFLIKPITPEHLVAAVLVRLRRYHVLRAYVERDSLTGLLNHAVTKENIAIEIARAGRQQRNFCFAMLDMDNFKAVNDTYGHLVGDRVLKSLTGLLKQRLRKTDIIGRVGGEEFGVILPDTRSADAATLLNELRAAFSAVRQHAEGSEFTTTFSCGIAEFRSGDNVDDICGLADRALYQAKQDGRNRIALGVRHDEAG